MERNDLGIKGRTIVFTEAMVYRGSKYKEYWVHPRHLSHEGRNLLYDGIKIEDIRYVYKGKEFRPGPNSKVVFRNCDIRKIDFRNQPFQYIEFHCCWLRVDHIGNSKFRGVRFSSCTLGEGRHGHQSGRPVEMLFRGSFEVLDNIVNQHYGPLYFVNGTHIVCGCRCFTLRQARRHWGLGSLSGGYKFSSDALAFIEKQLKIQKGK